MAPADVGAPRLRAAIAFGAAVNYLAQWGIHAEDNNDEPVRNAASRGNRRLHRRRAVSLPAQADPLLSRGIGTTNCAGLVADIKPSEGLNDPVNLMLYAWVQATSAPPTSRCWSTTAVTST